ncbi:MAG: hypothetical protein Q9191_006533, partial [Dirinaria sp. TL-2023a]
MTSPRNIEPPASFDPAFRRLRDLIDKDDARAFETTMMKDVWNAATQVERQLEQRRCLRGFHRIRPFLAGIEQYSKVVEVLCNVQIAQSHISALESLIDAYAMIGEAMPRFERLSSAFKDDANFQRVVGLFYEDILEFHRRAYKYFRRRAWMMFFESFWKNFDYRFQRILENLRKHRDLIDQEANAIDISEAKKWRNDCLESIQQWRMERASAIEKTERERLGTQVREAVAWFGATGEQDEILARISRACGPTHWTLENEKMKMWLGGSRHNLLLWLDGNPGAGKSVACSKIIDHVRDSSNSIGIFYFCQHTQTSQNTSNEILRSFATQLLAANTELAPYILDTFANNGLKPSKQHISSIIERLMMSFESIRVVVDGLDEWPSIEQEEVIHDILKMKGSSPGACKILISSRPVSPISKLLETKPRLRLADYPETVNATIAAFVGSRLDTLRQRFDTSIIDELGAKITQKAKELYYDHEVQEAIETLPEGLYPLY